MSRPGLWLGDIKLTGKLCNAHYLIWGTTPDPQEAACSAYTTNTHTSNTSPNSIRCALGTFQAALRERVTAAKGL